MENKIKALCDLITEQSKARLIKCNLACDVNLKLAEASYIIGKKYIKINTGTSGKYMVDIATGLVYGKNWGGGYGAYPSRELQAKTQGELIQKAQKELKTGGLDSGMGFESLKGARLDIVETETVKIKGKIFEHHDNVTEFIGDLTEKEQDFLLDCSI